MAQPTSYILQVFETGIGNLNNQQVLANVVIYKGSALGFSAGYVRQLVAGDVFAGFAQEGADNTGGASGDIDCQIVCSGVICNVAITAAAITDIDKVVYMSFGNTFTFTSTGNTPIGRVIRWNATGSVNVAFNASYPGSVPLTDNAGGTAGSTINAGAGAQSVTFPLTLAELTAATFVTFTPGFAFKILGIAAYVKTVATTGSKLGTVTPAIGGVSTTGGALALTSANCTPLAAVITGSAITAANTGTATDVITLVGSAVTSFVEGTVVIVLKLQNMDTVNALASLNTI